jgi:hypothetical protein
MPSVPPVESHAPTQVPSVAPSAVPTTPPSTQPSVQPTLTPSTIPTACPSAIPSQEPSRPPSVTPSAAPSIIPSAQPIVQSTQRPTLPLPSAVPTLIPTAAMAAVNLYFDTTLVMNGVTTATLADDNSKTAVCATVAAVTGVAIDKVKVLESSMESIANRLLRSAARKLLSYNVNVVVRITSSTADFPDTAVTHDAQVLFVRLNTALIAAVNSTVFTSTLRAKSLEYDAPATENVGMVTLTVVDPQYTEVWLFFCCFTILTCLFWVYR